MPTITREQLEEQLESGRMANLVLCGGPENWLKEQFLENLLKKTFTPESQNINFDRFDANTCSGGEIANAAQSLPFLSDKRLVLVQNAEELSAADARVVGEVLSNLPDSTILLFFYNGKVDMREEIPAKVASQGQAATFWTPFPNQLPFWTVNEAKKRGKVITLEAARLLSEECDNLHSLSQELDKLILFVGKKGKIDVHDVHAHGLPDEMGNYSKLEEAIWNRDLRQALKEGEILLEMGIKGEFIFPVFERIFRQLTLARFYINEKGMGKLEAANTLKMKGKTKQALLESGLKSYSDNEIKTSFRKIIEANMDLKRGVLTSELALSLLTLNVVGSGRRSALSFR